MFIRETVTVKAGVRYVQHRLVENIRIGSKVKQTMLMSLGTLSLPRERWSELVDAIEHCLRGTKPLLPHSPDILVLAENYAKQLVEKQLQEQKNCEQLQGKEAEHVLVDMNSLEIDQNRTVGGEEFLLQEMEEDLFDEALSFLTNNERDYAKILIAGRALHPASERETTRWAREVSALPELLGMNTAIHDTGLHRVAAKLLDHHDELEDFLAHAARKKFDLQQSIILYDLTNTYFEGQLDNVPLAKHGRSKERRKDCPLLTVALQVDEDGFVKRSHFYEGNIAESPTLKAVLDHLTKEQKHGDRLALKAKTIVIDAGIASEDNLQLILDAGYDYVAVSRGKTFEDEFWQGCEEKKLPLKKKDEQLKVWLRKTEHESFLRVHSVGKARKAKAILSRRMEGFEKGIEALSEKLEKPRTQKSTRKINEQIGRLSQQFQVRSLYDIDIQEEKGIVTSLSLVQVLSDLNQRRDLQGFENLAGLGWLKKLAAMRGDSGTCGRVQKTRPNKGELNITTQIAKIISQGGFSHEG